MGSDLFSVNVEKYKELKTKDAIKSALLRGEYTEQVYYFFNSLNEKDWIEITLFINTIHPDVSVDFDELFYTRIIDEGVTAWNNPNSIDYDKSPLSIKYGNSFWSYPEEFQPVIFVSTIKYFPGKPMDKYSGGLDDAVEVTLFIPKKYAPNLKGFNGWDSRAWGGVNAGYSYGLEKMNKPKKMVVKKMNRDMFIPVNFEQDKKLFIFNKETHKWREENINEKEFENPNQYLKNIIKDSKGNTWEATSKGVLCKTKDKVKYFKKKDGVHTNKPEKVFLLDNDRILAYNKSGISIYENDEWKLFNKHSFKKTENITVDKNNNIWLQKGKNIEVITSSGELIVFPKGNWSYILGLIPFRENKVLATTSTGIILLDYDTQKFRNIISFDDINEIDFSDIKVDSNYNIWAMTQGNLILFKNNEPAIYFIFEDALPLKLTSHYDKMPYDVFTIRENGDIWVHKYNFGFVKINSKTVKRAIGSPALNKDLVKYEELFILRVSEDNSSLKTLMVKEKKVLNKAEMAKKFPKSNLKGSSFKSNTELARSLCENGRALGKKSIENILNKHHEALKNFKGGSWQTLDVSGLVIAIIPGTSEGMASFTNKKISDKVSLKNKNLTYCNFCSSMAEDVKFTNSNLENAIFTDSFMKGADFTNCNLTNVDFSRADLRNANFKNADLTGCDFENANLEGANFKGAKGLERAVFPGAKLKNIIDI